MVPIVMGTSIVAGSLVQLALHELGRPDLAFVGFSVGLFAAAAVNWVVGKRLNGRPGREVIDANTGQRLVLRRVHRLFWIPMQYWSIPVALAAFVPLLALRGLTQ